MAMCNHLVADALFKLITCFWEFKLKTSAWEGFPGPALILVLLATASSVTKFYYWESKPKNIYLFEIPGRDSHGLYSLWFYWPQLFCPWEWKPWETSVWSKFPWPAFILVSLATTILSLGIKALNICLGKIPLANIHFGFIIGIQNLKTCLVGIPLACIHFGCCQPILCNPVLRQSATASLEN